jgi:Ternary complex associated domain 2
MQCARCSGELPGGARFCPHCGNPVPQAGGITTGDVKGTGIAIGHGASASVQQGLRGGDVPRLFAAVYERIDERPDDPAVDKDEVAQTVRAVEQETAKGSDADPGKVEGWLRRLADLAPDVLEVTLATLANPVAGVTMAVRKTAERVRAELGRG